MTNAQSKPSTNSGTKKSSLFPPVIGLERYIEPTLEKGEYEALKCYSNPGIEDSPSFTVNLGYFRSGTPEEFLAFEQSLNRVIEGQNLTTAQSCFTTAQSCFTTTRR